MGLLDPPAPNRALAPVKTPLLTPSGFSWTTHPLVGKLFIDQYGLPSTTLDPTTRKYVGGVTYYVDSVAGNAANDGLSDATALDKITTALLKSDVGTVMVKGNGPANPYYRGRGTNNVQINKNINIIGYGSDVPYITTHDILTYTLAAGQTYTYQTTRSSVSEVVDMVNASAGSGIRLTQVASIAACEALAGSWYQNGSTLYVHASDNRNLITTQPSRIWALLAVTNITNSGDFTTYLENLIVYGGVDSVLASCTTSAGATFTAVNVETAYSSATINGGGNNLSLLGCDAVLVNCDTHHSGLDGYNYHAAFGKVCRSVEINCRGADCGHGITDQCSTAHDGSQVIRVGGSYRRSAAANVADVNDNTQSWNIGLVGDTAGKGFANFHCGISTDAGVGAKMWLHACTGANADWETAIYGTGQILNRGSRLIRNRSTVTAY